MILLVDDVVLAGDFVVGDDGFSVRETTTRPVLHRWDEYEFRTRFTAAERIAIDEALSGSAALRDFVGLLKSAGRTGTFVASTDANLMAGMNALVEAHLISAERKAEIFGG